MAAKLNRLILQLRATRLRMMLAETAAPETRAAKQPSKPAAPASERETEAPRRVVRRRSHG